VVWLVCIGSYFCLGGELGWDVFSNFNSVRVAIVGYIEVISVRLGDRVGDGDHGRFNM